MKLAWLLLLVSSFCAAQNLPDAPQPSTTCVEKNGKPCPEWVHKLVGQYPPLPEQYTYPSWHEATTGGHAFLFWSTEGLAVASTIADIEVTHQGIAHHVCTEGNEALPPKPSRGQLYANGFEYTGPLVAAGFLLRKLGIPFAPYAPALVIAGKHAYGAYSWRGCY